MTITIEPTKGTIDGKSYFLELGTIVSTFLGREDHGIFTYTLEFEFNDCVQSAGNYSLGDPENFGMHLHAIMDFLGSWESIKGRRAYVLRETQYGPILGLLREDRSKYIIFSEVLDGKD